METLVAFAHHRDHNGSFSSPSRNFREINCRTFQSRAGILPTPANPNVVQKQIPHEQNPKQPTRVAQISSIPIPVSIKHSDCSVNEFFYSELWAGPAYSNSPPPSSLPIPTFSVKPKRTVSLDLPSISSSSVDLLALISKSAPTSPTIHRQNSSQVEFFNSANNSATKNLRRMLNLDMVKSD